MLLASTVGKRREAAGVSVGCEATSGAQLFCSLVAQGREEREKEKEEKESEGSCLII